MELAQTIGVLITIVVSISSLILSILSFIQHKPRLMCEIIKAYYGHALSEKDVSKINVVAVINLTLQNPSSANITIYDLKLVIGKNYYNYKSPQNGNEQNITLLCPKENPKDDHSGEREFSIPFNSKGNTLPFKINSYDAIIPTFVFDFIPNALHGTIQAKLIIKTTAGKLKKRIKLHPFNLNTIIDFYEIYKIMRSDVNLDNHIVSLTEFAELALKDL